MHDFVQVDGVRFPFTFCRSRRRTISITVRPDRSLAVRAPLRLSQSAIRDFVISKAPWVIKVWGRLDALPPRQEPSYGEGTPIPLLGAAYPLVIREGRRRSVELDGGNLLLTAPEVPTRDAVRRTIEKWYLQQARLIVPQRAAHCLALMEPEALTLPSITLRVMRSRWGSYSYRTGRVCLNLHLLKAPLFCLDYVIIHELCHIKVRHHGAEFWELVARYAPGYREARDLLRKTLLG